MPKPVKGEKEDDFISRAIREFMKEGFSQKEAVGRAYGFWKSYKASPKKK